MGNVFAQSWELVKASADVLNKDKELLVFPILSAIGMIILTAIFLVPMLFVGFSLDLSGKGLTFGSYALLFLFYVLQYFIVISSNTALVGAALIRLRGGDPTVADGIKIAAKHLLPILGYSLIAGTVGLLLSTIRDKSKGLGSFVIGLFGMVWNVATFLVVPILAVEDVGPIEAIKRSIAYLKKTWGEQLVGNFTFSAIFTLAGVVLVILCMAAIFLAAYLSLPAWTIILTAVGGVFLILLIVLVSSTLSGIYTAAVYQYATTGQTGEFFENNVVQDAFRRQP